MNTALTTVLTALKDLFSALEPHCTHLSFTVLIGKPGQGLSQLLQHSPLQTYNETALQHASLHYNEQAVVLRLQEEWLMQSPDLLAHSLRRIDDCFPPVGISAIAMAIAIPSLTDDEQGKVEDHIAAHKQLWLWVQESLPRAIPSHIIITKMDSIAGFCEFFHQDLRPEQNGLLGLFYNPRRLQGSDIEELEISYSQLLQQLDQAVFRKIHAVRSSIKRTLIREFPLQMQSLSPALKLLLQQLKLGESHLRAIYFTSAQQGGKSFNRLNARMNHEYALCLPRYHYQAQNAQNYFVDGCLRDLLSSNQTGLPRYRKARKYLPYVASAVALCMLLLSSQHYRHRSHQLDNVSKDLLKYEQIAAHDYKSMQALYHLGQANQAMQNVPTGLFSPSSLSDFQNQLHQHTVNTLRQVLLPQLLAIAEQRIKQGNSSAADKVDALRTYIMLGDPSRFNAEKVRQWYQRQWKDSENITQKMTVLQQSLRQPMQAARLNETLIQDARNTLNALPDGYFYYTLARQHFSKEQRPIAFAGFSIGQTSLPVIYTKKGYLQTAEKLDVIVPQLQKEQWVTGRVFPKAIKPLILEAYSYDYQNWWQSFLRKTQPKESNSYNEAQSLLKTLRENDSLSALITLTQQETGPISHDPGGFFNRNVAKTFNTLNWLSQSVLEKVRLQQADLEKFISNINLLQDQKESVFELTRQRFLNKHSSDPLSAWYLSSAHYPSPLKEWSQQLGNNLWFMLINDARAHIDQQWQQQIQPFYKRAIHQKYPFTLEATEDVTLDDFHAFFSPSKGALQQFTKRYIQPFLDTTKAQWAVKEVNGYRLPIHEDALQQLMLVNILQSMFFEENRDNVSIHFNLEKINLDPMVKSLAFQMGKQQLHDSQYSPTSHESPFSWPENNAHLALQGLDGQKWALAEQGVWGIFKLLEKVNIMQDDSDASSLQILFEINGNSGRYRLSTPNAINPFTPGILRKIVLPEHLV